MKGLLRRTRDTWHFILSERETIDTLVLGVMMSMLGVAAVVWADVNPAATPLLVIGALRINGDVNLGTVGSAFIVVWQVGRWGRRTMNKFSKYIEHAERVPFVEQELTRLREKELAQIQKSISAIDARCPLRHAKDDAGDADEDRGCG